MKSLLIIFLLFVCHTNNAQVFAKWQHYINKNNTLKNEKYFFSSIDYANKNQYKIIKKLDADFCIVEVENSNVFNNELKTTTNLWKLSSNFVNHNDKREYILSTQNMISLQTALKFVSISIKQVVTDKIVVIESNSNDIINKILPLKDVYSVTQESLTPIIETKISDQNFSVNNINKANAIFSNIKGQNQIVSIKDELFDIKDVDLLNKYIISTTQPSVVSNHASGMATIIAGLGNSSVLGKGVATQAKIQSSNFLIIFPDNIQTLSETKIQNHSYGTQIENFYGFLANAYDEHLFSNPTFTHCFSSGNKGQLGFKSITGNFKQSKNSLVVGAIDQNEVITNFSSKGPAHDGRIKPEIVAFSSQGTSNSNAITTGVLTLMKQYYKELFTNDLNNDLAKAIIINSSKDLGNVGPDYTYGYGNIDAYKSLKTITDTRFLRDNVTINQTKNHTVTLPSNVKYLKVTLVWNDLPSTINNNISLVNDLDLVVTSPVNSNYLPYVLNPELLQQPATIGQDHINNIEQVVVNNPTSGQFNFAVSATTITNTSQEYAIAYEYELQNNFEWNYPIANDNFPYDGKIISPFKWNTTYANATGNLEISYDDGLTWQIINTNVNLESGQFAFTPSEKLFTKAKLKMTIGNTNYVSNSFIISYDLNINTTLVCNDATEIVWEKPDQVFNFNIYQLFGNELLFKEQTSSLKYVYSGNEIYTVSPLFNGVEGIKSEATLYNEPNSNCYFQSLIAEEINNDKIKINATLFSNYKIKSLELIKVINNSENIINTVSNIDSRDFEFFDNNPVEGNNKYKINLILENNNYKVNSEIFGSLYFGKQNFLIYPTILNNFKPINVESKQVFKEKISFTVYSLLGQQVFSAEINSQKASFDIGAIATGTYIYKIDSLDGNKQTGKIIIF